MSNSLRPVDPLPLKRPSIANIAWVQTLKPLKIGGVMIPAGTMYKGKDVATFGHEQLWAGVAQRKLTYGLVNTPMPVFTPAPAAAAAAPVVEGKKMVVNAGFGKFDVIQGNIIAKGLTKDEATALAADAEPEVTPEPQAKTA